MIDFALSEDQRTTRGAVWTFIAKDVLLLEPEGLRKGAVRVGETWK